MKCIGLYEYVYNALGIGFIQVLLFFSIVSYVVHEMSSYLCWVGASSLKLSGYPFELSLLSDIQLGIGESGLTL